MLLKENGKVILKAGRIVEYAPDVDENVKEEDHIFVTSNETGVFDVYHAEQRRYLLKNAHFTADNFCEESGTPIVFTKDTANYYISPEGIVHDLRLDKCDVYFSQDERGIPNHNLVFRIVAGIPEVLYRESGYNPAQSFGDRDYRTCFMLSRLPQGDHVDNPFIPFFITNSYDLGAFVGTEPPSEQVLRNLADQYVRLTEGKYFDKAGYLHEVARHFREIATNNGSQTIASIRRDIERNNQDEARHTAAYAPQIAEMEKLNEQINAINKALGQPEYDYDPDWALFGKTAPYEVVPDNIKEMPQEIQDAYEERKQLMNRHKYLYAYIDVPEIDHTIENFNLARRIDCIEYATTIEDLASKVAQEQRVMSATKSEVKTPTAQATSQTTVPTATAPIREVANSNPASQNNDNPTE